MKNYYSKSIDSLGRIVVPKQLRDKLALKPGESLDISLENNTIVMKRNSLACVFCNSTEDIITYKGKNICKKCQREICSSFLK